MVVSLHTSAPCSLLHAITIARAIGNLLVKAIALSLVLSAERQFSRLWTLQTDVHAALDENRIGPQASTSALRWLFSVLEVHSWSGLDEMNGELGATVVCLMLMPAITAGTAALIWFRRSRKLGLWLLLLGLFAGLVVRTMAAMTTTAGARLMQGSMADVMMAGVVGTALRLYF